MICLFQMCQCCKSNMRLPLILPAVQDVAVFDVAVQDTARCCRTRRRSFGEDYVVEVHHAASCVDVG